MAKGQVTEAQLGASLTSVGNISGLTGKPAQRDSPFGAPERKPTKKLQRSTDRSESPEAIGSEAPLATATAPKSLSPTNPQAKPAPKVMESQASTLPARFEDVTVPLDPIVRDAVGGLARELQRRRSEKRTRITANVVIRVAIDHFLETFRLNDGDMVNSEAELLELVRRKLDRS